MNQRTNIIIKSYNYNDFIVEGQFFENPYCSHYILRRKT